MPLNVPHNLPAIEILEKEGIFVMDDLRASKQDIRPLKIVLVNLMPFKIATETDFIRLLSNNSLQIDIVFVTMNKYQSKHTPILHLREFYKNFKDICEENYDGMIITGAPLELISFEEVNYWKELQKIFDWAYIHVTSTLYICWAAYAGLYHFYGIPKYPLKEKIFGVFEHTIKEASIPLFRGFDDCFFVPHSRYSMLLEKDLLSFPSLQIVAESKEAGVHIVLSRGGREIFMTGHAEYAPNALHDEYIRDLNKGFCINPPKNYYKGNDPHRGPRLNWRAHAQLLFKNWLNYYVYQSTPYNPLEIEILKDLHLTPSPNIID